MPTFTQSLQGRDLGHLKIVASLWGIDLDTGEPRLALQRLESSLLTPERVRPFVAGLSADARNALEDLVQNQGRIPWALFTRRYGVVRELGAGKRDREQPHLQPSSPAEVLWYRALVARSFFDTPTGPEEFAYIPDDLLNLLPFAPEPPLEPLGRPATPDERAFVISASPRLLDHACTLLAALRLGLPEEEIRTASAGWVEGPLSLSPLPLSPAPLRILLQSAGLIDAVGALDPEPVRLHLEAKPGEALLALFQSWMSSTSFNELRLIPYLRAEGEWQNDPVRARQAVMGFLGTLPRKGWWSLPAFLADIQKRQPDFQRSAGDYDSWFIRDLRTGEYLRGFQNWHQVDGLLIRAILTGPLTWLGLLDLASPSEDAPVTAFRFSRWAEALLKGNSPGNMPAEDGSIQAVSDAHVVVGRTANRALRYQVARFCLWEGEKGDTYRYRLSPASLERARSQGLTIHHLLALLKRGSQPVPPSLIKALERWEARGTEARFERVLVLRLSSPEALAALRGSKAARFLGDPLGPTAVIVKPGAMAKVLAALAQLGYLGEAAPPEVDGERASEGGTSQTTGTPPSGEQS